MWSTNSGTPLPPSDRPCSGETADVSLAAVVLTLNEGRHIEDCLRDLRRFASRILVLDSGSSDATRELARRGGALVVFHPFADYASQRQIALDCLLCDWLLFVDADERIEPELGEEILEFCRSDREARHWAGATIPRRNLVVEGIPLHGGFWPDRQLRLMRPELASFRDSPPVHERAALDGAIHELKRPILHLNYESWAEFHARQRKYAELEVRNAGTAGRIPLLTLGRRFLHLFLYRYVRLSGWRDGLLGLKLAVLLAWYYGPLPLALALFRERTDSAD